MKIKGSGVTAHKNCVNEQNWNLFQIFIKKTLNRDFLFFSLNFKTKLLFRFNSKFSVKLIKNPVNFRLIIIGLMRTLKKTYTTLLTLSSYSKNAEKLLNAFK